MRNVTRHAVPHPSAACGRKALWERAQKLMPSHSIRVMRQATVSCPLSVFMQKYPVRHRVIPLPKAALKVNHSMSCSKALQGSALFKSLESGRVCPRSLRDQFGPNSLPSLSWLSFILSPGCFLLSRETPRHIVLALVINACKVHDPEDLPHSSTANPW